MSSAYIATMPTLQISNNAGTMMRIQIAPGSSASSAHSGSVRTRCRTVSRVRQPTSVSSCLTQSRLRSGSLMPIANSAFPPAPGSPGSLATGDQSSIWQMAAPAVTVSRLGLVSRGTMTR